MLIETWLSQLVSAVKCLLVQFKTAGKGRDTRAPQDLLTECRRMRSYLSDLSVKYKIHIPDLNIHLQVLKILLFFNFYYHWHEYFRYLKEILGMYIFAFQIAGEFGFKNLVIQGQLSN